MLDLFTLSRRVRKRMTAQIEFFVVVALLSGSKVRQPRGTSLQNSKKLQAKCSLLKITRHPLSTFWLFEGLGRPGSLLGDVFWALVVSLGCLGLCGLLLEAGLGAFFNILGLCKHLGLYSWTWRPGFEIRPCSANSF